MEIVRRFSETLARKTSRRSFFGKGAGVATGALLGVAAGSLAGAQLASAGSTGSVCVFPGPPCPCGGCTSAGACGKPCNFAPFAYASGCWVTAGQTCCDCNCGGRIADELGTHIHSCGCGSDYHNDPKNCP